MSLTLPRSVSVWWYRFAHDAKRRCALRAFEQAVLFQPGAVTPCTTRFSTVTVGRGYPDSARNPRGFATKCYTPEGNYDLVGLNWPIFFV